MMAREEIIRERKVLSGNTTRTFVPDWAGSLHRAMRLRPTLAGSDDCSIESRAKSNCGNAPFLITLTGVSRPWITIVGLEKSGQWPTTCAAVIIVLPPR